MSQQRRMEIRNVDRVKWLPGHSVLTHSDLQIGKATVQARWYAQRIFAPNELVEKWAKNLTESSITITTSALFKMIASSKET